MHRKQIVQTIALLKRKGIEVTCAQHRGSGHIGLRIADASGHRALLIVASTPSCYRSVMNTVADAKRALARQAVIA